MKFVCLRPCFVYLMFASGLFACKRESTPETVIPSVTPGNDAAVAASWYNLELKLIRETNGFTPTMASKAIAFTGMTLYESVVWGARDAASLKRRGHAAPVPEKGKKYNWTIAANSAMAVMVKNMFPNADQGNLALITQLEIDNLDAFSDSCTQDEIIRSVNFGRQIGGSIYKWSTSEDGYARF